jgi:hypothetical protein
VVYILEAKEVEVEENADSDLIAVHRYAEISHIAEKYRFCATKTSN